MILIQKNICRFQICVNSAFRVQVVQGFDQLEAQLFHSTFGQLSLVVDEFVEIASRAVLEDEPEMIARFVPTIELDQVLVLEFCEERNLHVHLLLPRFFY